MSHVFSQVLAYLDWACDVGNQDAFGFLVLTFPRMAALRFTPHSTPDPPVDNLLVDIHPDTLTEAVEQYETCIFGDAKVAATEYAIETKDFKLADDLGYTTGLDRTLLRQERDFLYKKLRDGSILSSEAQWHKRRLCSIVLLKEMVESIGRSMAATEVEAAGRALAYLGSCKIDLSNHMAYWHSDKTEEVSDPESDIESEHMDIEAADVPVHGAKWEGRLRPRAENPLTDLWHERCKAASLFFSRVLSPLSLFLIFFFCFITELRAKRRRRRDRPRQRRCDRGHSRRRDEDDIRSLSSDEENQPREGSRIQHPRSFPSS